MHERIRRAIGTGWTTEEWAHVAMGHPIARLLMQRKRSEADALLRQYTAVHEAGHGLMAKLIGVDVEQIVIGHLHEVQGATTLGFTEYRVDRRRPLDAAAWVLLDLAGIAGHETVWPHGWGLDQAAWTPPGETGALRGEAVAGGDLWEARERIKHEVIAGRRVLGKTTTADALVAAYEQTEALLMGCRGRLLRLSGHLMQYGSADRTVIASIFDLGE